VKDSRYEEQSLIKEFKRGLSTIIKRKLEEAENPLSTIEE